ncbi:MAG: hypothetical protein ABIZ52_02245 [Candidatus Limnocylindrales bacterium]
MQRRLAFGFAILTLALALPAGALAAAPTSSFTGSWVSTDYDGSHQTLVVSSGGRPSVVYQDFYASGCDSNAGPATHWVSAGTGAVEGDVLWISYRKSGCGTFLMGGYEDYYIYDAGSDTLTDSAGIVWTRTR